MLVGLLWMTNKHSFFMIYAYITIIQSLIQLVLNVKLTT